MLCFTELKSHEGKIVIENSEISVLLTAAIVVLMQQ